MGTFIVKETRITLNMFKVLITIALVGAVFADDTCEDCSMVGTKTSAAFTTAEAIKAESDLILDEVCAAAVDLEECLAGFPAYWGNIALALSILMMDGFLPKSFVKMYA